MRSKHELSHAFAFAAAAQSARQREFGAGERRSPKGFRPTTFRKRADPNGLARLGACAPAPPRDAVFAAIQLERQVKWMRTQLDQLRADDALIRRLCGKRALPP